MIYEKNVLKLGGHKNYDFVADLFYDLVGLGTLNEEDANEAISKLNKNSGFQKSKEEKCSLITLDEILVKYFKSGFKYLESTSSEGYVALTDLLYDLANMKIISLNVVNETIDYLDELCNMHGFYDDDGHIITDDEEVKKRREI